MTQHFPINPDTLDYAFVPEGTPTFADLILRLKSDETLSPTRRRDLISGLTRIAKFLNRPPHDVPCHGRWLQPKLSKLSAPALGLSEKGLQNAISNARAAMAHAGLVERRSNRIADLSPEWRVLWERVLSSGGKTLPPALCRFVHFLNRAGVNPHDVTEGDAKDYLEALTRNEISKSPETAFRAAVNGWNLARRRIPEWPDIIIPLCNRQKKITQEDRLSPSLIKDLDQLLGQLADPDPFSEVARSRGLRPATIAQYRLQLMRFASELVHSGVEPDQIISVKSLLDPELVERGLRHMLSRNNNQTTKSISEVAALLRNLSRTLNLDPGIQSKLSDLAKRVAAKPQLGMTPKNRERLRVLQIPQNTHRLLTLPEHILTAAAAGTGKAYTRALAREDALAIAILLICPIRIGNLASLHLERNLHRPGDGRVFLVLSEQEVKNERSQEFELTTDLVRLVDQHLATRVPHLCPAGTSWLFPRRDGAGPIDPQQVSSRLSKRILKETGLKVNAHLFRHFAVMNWLDANPGGYEVARRLLGHSEVSHTINMYSGLEIKTATRAFADLITAKQASRI